MQYKDLRLVGIEVMISLTFFHGPLTLPYILITISCVNMILSDNELIWDVV